MNQPDPQPSSTSGKIRCPHLERLAVVYVRQSTQRQVLENRESTDLQYKLTRKAEELGWRPDRILVIDYGQFLFEGAPAEVQAHAGVVAAYLGGPVS